MPNTYELVLNLHDFSGNYFANVLHYQLSEGGTATAWEYAKGLADKWFTSPTFTDFMLLLGTDVVLDFMTAKRVTGTGGPSYTLISQSIGTGTAVSSNTAFAADVQWQSGAATNRPGHTFVGGVPADAIAQGAWSNGYITSVGIWVTAMLSNLTLSGSLGTATFGHFTRKGKIFDAITHGVLRPKPTGMNKRTKPLI